jgi:Transposase
MYYIGLDVHKKTISYCVKDVSGQVHREGQIGATRRELDGWMKTLPQPWTVAMEATIFTGWIYDHLLPHAQQVKVAHPLMLRAIAAAKKKNDRIDAGKVADCPRCDFLRSATWHRPRFVTDGEPCATATCWCARWCR